MQLFPFWVGQFIYDLDTFYSPKELVGLRFIYLQILTLDKMLLNILFNSFYLQLWSNCFVNLPTIQTCSQSALRTLSKAALIYYVLACGSKCLTWF